MKKIVLLSGLVLFSAAQADAAAKDAVSGFYAGLGICWMHSQDELKMTDGDIEGDGSDDAINLKVYDKKFDKVGGSLVAGYGTFVSGNFYLGAEVMVDFAGNNEKKGTVKVANENATFDSVYRSKVKGFVPSLAVRLGYWCCPIDSMVYLKAGAAYVQSEYQEQSELFYNDTKKMNKIVPLIGLGVEKNIYSHLNLRLEGDYRFRAQKTTKHEQTEVGTSRAAFYNVKDRLSGFSIRLMATYSF